MYRHVLATTSSRNEYDYNNMLFVVSRIIYVHGTWGGVRDGGG